MKYRSTYPSHFNCRTFYKCNKNRQSLPMCCNKGYAYDHNVQGCAPDPYCKLHCAEREKVQTTIAPTTPKISMESKITRITNESNYLAMYLSLLLSHVFSSASTRFRIWLNLELSWNVSERLHLEYFRPRIKEHYLFLTAL